MRRHAASLGLLIALSLAGGSSCGPPARGNGTNVLLVTLETTRADHLGAWGYPRPTSPRIDALAKRGALFERDSTVSPRTNPSLASLVTSSYPHEHGVRNLFLPLEPGARTLAEVLSDAGYVTGAIQTHPRLVKASGFAQGFGTYDDDFEKHPLADQACATAGRWIDEASGGRRPWFLWVHLMDPHWTYEPPPTWRSRFGPEDPRPFEVYRAINSRERTIGPIIFQNDMPPDEVRAFIDLYDAEIAFTDEAVGALLAHLDRKGLASRTVVILTADHGESLGEHHYFFEHGDFGTEPEVHVPLVIAQEGKIPGGLRVPWTVRSLDVGPTVLDLAGLPPEPTFRGESLVPLMVGDPAGGKDRLSFGETDDALHEENTRREVRGIVGKWRWAREGRFKLMHVPRGNGSVERPLYDLVEDPAETRDVAAEHPDVARRLGEALDAWIREDRMQDREYHISPESRALLRSLGYVN